MHPSVRPVSAPVTVAVCRPAKYIGLDYRRGLAHRQRQPHLLSAVTTGADVDGAVPLRCVATEKALRRAPRERVERVARVRDGARESPQLLASSHAELHVSANAEFHVSANAESEFLIGINLIIDLVLHTSGATGGLQAAREPSHHFSS